MQRTSRIWTDFSRFGKLFRRSSSRSGYPKFTPFHACCQEGDYLKARLTSASGRPFRSLCLRRLKRGALGGTGFPELQTDKMRTKTWRRWKHPFYPTNYKLWTDRPLATRYWGSRRLALFD